MEFVNRTLWTVIGLILTGAGGFGIVASTRDLPGLDRDAALAGETVLRTWRDWGDWAWAGLIAGGLILALLGALLIRAQLRRRGGPALSDVTLAGPTWPDPQAPATGEVERSAGRTRVRASALTHALHRDLRHDPRVHRAAVRITGDAPEPTIHARLDLGSAIDLDGLRRHVTESIERFRATTGLRPRTVNIDVNVAHANTARVR